MTASSPPLTEAQRSNTWPLTAHGYMTWRRRSLTLLSGQPFGLEREARLFLGLCRPQAGERWLDAGTSAGFYAGVLARQGCEVVAADLSAAMLDVARRDEPDPRIEYVQVNLEASGWPGGGFDGVTVGATLNETARPDRFLQECARLLRPGGRLWLMFIPRSGGAGQALLSRLGGLNFPDVSWVAAQVPHLSLVHVQRSGLVGFTLFQKPPAQHGLSLPPFIHVGGGR